MSKSVLVIDTPEKCICCPLLNGADECTAQDDAANFKAGNSWDELMKGCPLKPLPEKKEEMGMPRTPSMNDIKRIGFQKGWNACIDEIIGGNYDD